MNHYLLHPSKTILIPLLLGLFHLAGCGAIRQAPKPPEPKYMDMTDKFEIIDVPETTKQVPVFIKDGKPFCFTGTNNYYVTFDPKTMVDDVMDRAVAMGLDVFRIWGFIDRGSLDETVRSVDDIKEIGTKNGVYFQYWDKENGRAAVNEGEDGLQRLDYVLHAARERGLKLIIVLTNNWHDMGGMDQYVVWFGKKYHHEFYTDETIRQAFKNWINTLLTRKNSIDGIEYRNDPVVFAWELANEPNYKNREELDAIDGWDASDMVTWADEMSRYIKEVDQNHLVAIGDEGWFKSEGKDIHVDVDHEALCALKNIDYCTFHLYPDDWGTDSEFGSDWIRRHIDAAEKLGKPTVNEEYGTKVKRNPKTLEITWGWERQKADFTNWNTLMKKLGGNGQIVWMLCGSDDVHGIYPDYDGYCIYKGMPSGDLVEKLAADFKSNAAACKTASSYLKDPPVSEFITIAKPEQPKQ